MRYLAIGVGVAIMLAAAAAWLLVPIHYEVFGLLRIDSRPPAVFDAPGPSPHTDFGVFVRTQIELIKSGIVARHVVADPTIQELPGIQLHGNDAASWLRGQILVDNPDDSEIVRVAMRGRQPEEMKKIIDAVIQAYLQEFVGREQENRDALEAKLADSYQNHFHDLTRQMDALHQMEQVARTADTEAAKVAKRLAVERLEEALVKRARIRAQLEENAMQTTLRRAQEEEGQRTAGGAPAEQSVPASPPGLSLSLLVKQCDFLKTELDATEKTIAEEAERVESLECFSPNVAGKQEELRAAKTITGELRAELDRLGVEKLARERITKVDDAVLASSRGDAVRKNLACEALAILGLALVVGGLALRRGGSPGGRQAG